MGAKRRLDSLDRQIIAVLSRQPQIANKDIAGRLGVSESTISVRVDTLIKAKIIQPSVQQNITKAGYGMVGWIDVECGFEDIDRVANQIAQIETVFSISRFFENPFLQVMLVMKDVDELRDVVENRIGTIAGVTATSVDVSLGQACIKSGIASL